MLTEKILAPKECEHCHCLYTPNRYVARRYCSRLCANHASRAADPIVWEARRSKATEASRKIAATRRALALEREFGPLSVRELQIAAAIRKQSYMDGYNAACRPLRKTKQAKALR